MIKTADTHAHQKTSAADQASSKQLSGQVKDELPRTYFREASYSSSGDLSATDSNDVDQLITDVGDQSRRHELTKSTKEQQVNSTVPDNSENHDGAAGAPEPVLDRFPREYFREASCASFGCSLPTLHVENGEVKVEDVSEKTDLPLSGKLAALEEGGKNADEPVDDEVVISAAEQCVDATAFGRHLVIASHINEDGPKFWHLHNGVLDVEMTENIDAQYKKSLADQNITFGGRNHAQLFSFDDFLVYVRKRSTSMIPCVIQVLPNKRLSVVGHIHLPDSYFSVFLPERSSPNGPFSMYVVREGMLEQRSADMKLLRTIEMPKLTDDIPNLSSNAGKKRLLSYKVAVTEDRRYFVIVCPTVGGKNGRYLDVVDLKENCYVHRTALDARLLWKVLEDGVYYLARPAGADLFELQTVRTLTDGTRTDDYCCIIQSDLQIRSPGGQYGVEFTPDHSIHIWRTVSTLERSAVSREHNTPTSPVSDQTVTHIHHNAPTDQNAQTSEQPVPTPKHCCTLSGHVAEVTCVSWASTGSRLLVSGSRDNTVRLWSLVGAGCQLCLFHVLGTIDNVHFDETSRYVVVHCSYAPQRKRAIVLRLNNVRT